MSETPDNTLQVNVTLGGGCDNSTFTNTDGDDGENSAGKKKKKKKKKKGRKLTTF